MKFFIKFLSFIFAFFLFGCAETIMFVDTQIEMVQLENGCSKDNAEDCRVLGIRYLPENFDALSIRHKFATEKEHYSKAEFFFEKACRLESSDACYRLAELYKNGHGDKANVSKMIQYYDEACSLKEYYSCVILAKLYYNSDYIQKDLSKTTYYYDKACSLKDYSSCWYSGKLYEESNILKSVEDYTRICNYCNSQRRDKDYTCDDELQKLACFSLAVLYDDGKILQRDIVKAREFYQKSCFPSRGISCFGVALEDKNESDMSYSLVEFYRNACNNDNGMGCNNLGFLYQNGIKLQKDQEKANMFYQKACDLKDNNGCYNVALMFHNENEDVIQNVAIDTMFSRLFTSNEEIKNNDDKNKVLQDTNKLYKKSCDLKNGAGCYKLASNYCNIKVIKDAGLSQKFYKKACRLKYKTARVNPCDETCENERTCLSANPPSDCDDLLVKSLAIGAATIIKNGL